jgi:hypothetical protein
MVRSACLIVNEHRPAAAEIKLLSIPRKYLLVGKAQLKNVVYRERIVTACVSQKADLREAAKSTEKWPYVWPTT